MASAQCHCLCITTGQCSDCRPQQQSGNTSAAHFPVILQCTEKGKACRRTTAASPAMAVSKCSSQKPVPRGSAGLHRKRPRGDRAGCSCLSHCQCRFLLCMVNFHWQLSAAPLHLPDCFFKTTSYVSGLQLQVAGNRYTDLKRYPRYCKVRRPKPQGIRG